MAIVETTYTMLKDSALRLNNEIADLDVQIEKLASDRTALKKELRAITGKIVTIELKDGGK